MKPTYHCIPCHINHIYRVISVLNLGADTAFELMKELTSIIAGDFSCPPDCAYEMYKSIRRRIDIDPFAEIKKESNALMMTLLPRLKSVVLSGNTLKQAMRIALAANLIDYGISAHTYNDDIALQFANIVDDITIPEDFYTQFIASVAHSKKILYIADNAGEIVADMLLIQHLPVGKITCVVRGGPIINDATMEDAKQIGLDAVVRVITTGDYTPGINLNRSSKDFLYELSQADMIILKGQGNFETMIDADVDSFVKKGMKMFFMFKVKCLPVAEFTQKKVGDSAFIIREI
ncbi:MAG: ARMT1-like domain-containing protein [Spirochaetes bacterium]|nr:ARMT1-like domain-containing protein [Spirochaetota bacterium]